MRWPRQSTQAPIYREAPTWLQFLAIILPAVIAASVLTNAGLDTTHRGALTPVTTAVAILLIGAAAGMIARRSLAATQLTPAGVRVRQTASRWQHHPWQSIDHVTPPTHSTGDAVLHLRDGTGVTLRGLPLDLADHLAVLVRDHTGVANLPRAAGSLTNDVDGTHRAVQHRRRTSRPWRR